MLKNPCPRVVVALALAFLTASCAHTVNRRKNKPVGSEVTQTLVLANDTVSSLKISSPPGTTNPPLLVQPREETRLEFTVQLEENVSPGRERQVVLVPEKSSPYFIQNALDLLMKARFGNGPEREIRVRLGKCLFDPAPTERAHRLPLPKPPLSGVPALHLCPSN